MKSGRKSVFLFMVFAILGALVMTVPAAAGGLYLGGGFQSNTFSNYLQTNWSHKSAIGWNVNAGLRLSDKTAIDAAYGTSKHDKASGAKSKFTWIEFGPKFFFNTDSKIQPYVTLGAGSYDIDINGVEYSGTGGFAGAGIEERGGRNHVVGIFIKGNIWQDDSPYLEAVTLSGGLNYSYYFGGF
jgi:hypothetical protein